MYVLVARAGDAPDFAPHLNQMVRVTAHDHRAALTAALASGAGRAPGTRRRRVPTLAVTTLTMVAPTCR